MSVGGIRFQRSRLEAMARDWMASGTAAFRLVILNGCFVAIWIITQLQSMRMELLQRIRHCFSLTTNKGGMGILSVESGERWTSL